MNKLTVAQNRALALAAEHGYVVVSKGFGRDKQTPNSITSGVYAKLVGFGLLTPYSNGATFKGEALRVESGKNGYLTEAGRTAHERQKAKTNNE